MLRSVQRLYESKLGALDGDIGEVKDFYFNDLLITERNLTRIHGFLQSDLKQFMKDTTTKFAANLQTPVFPQAMHVLRPNQQKVSPPSKAKKRDNIFSKSRDVREDRGTREMKTSHDGQTNHGK